LGISVLKLDPDAIRAFGIRITLLALTFAGVLASGVVKKRQRLEVGAWETPKFQAHIHSR